MVSFAVHLFIDAFPSGWMKAIMDVERRPKRAYFAYRDALSPVLVSIQTHRTRYFAGEELDMQAWVCNDREASIEDAQLHWQIVRDGEVLFAGRRPADVPAMTPTPQGTLRWVTPQVDRRTHLEVQMALIDANGRVIHDTTQPIEVWPTVATSAQPIAVLGEPGGPAWRLAEQLGLEPHRWNSDADEAVVLADHIANVSTEARALERFMERGGRLVMTDPILADHEAAGHDADQPTLRLGDAEMRIEPAGMNPRHFANPWTGHPIVADFDEHDVFLWHHQRDRIIRPILPLVMHTRHMQQILATGQGDWGVDHWRPCDAAAHATVGAGQLIVSLVSLADRVRTNPPAHLYARRLLGLAQPAR